MTEGGLLLASAFAVGGPAMAALYSKDGLRVAACLGILGLLGTAFGLAVEAFAPASFYGDSLIKV